MSLFIVLGTLTDEHVIRVTSELEYLGVASKVVDFLAKTDFVFSVNQRGDYEFYIDGQLLNEQIVIWDRVKIVKGTNLYPEGNYRSSDFTVKEWRAFYQLITGIYRDRTFNSLNSRVCLFKPYQQIVASKVGLLVPPTVITNSKNKIISIYDEEPNLIIKSLSALKVLPKEGENDIPYNIMTSELLKESVIKTDEEQFKICPNFIQKNIEKEYELRVVAVDTHIFSFKIRSQEKSYTKTDWRQGNITLKFEPCEIDHDIEIKLIRFLKKMGLFSGSFDLIVDKKGQYWFLECNQDGQWSWLDSIAGGVIAKQFARSFKEQIEKLTYPSQIAENGR